MLFHSTEAELQKYEAELPFAVVADPDRTLYRRFGVEHGVRAITNRTALRAAIAGQPATIRAAIQQRRAPLPIKPTGGNLGLPADLLISADGNVTAVKYGGHAYDQWSVDEVLGQAR